MTFNLCMAVVSHVLDDHDDDNGHDDDGGESSLCVWSELEDPDATYSLLDPDLVVGRHFWGDLGLGNLFDEHDGLTVSSILCIYGNNDGDYHDRHNDSDRDDREDHCSLHVSSELGLGNLSGKHDDLAVGSSCSKHDDVGGGGCSKRDTARITLYGACLFLPRVAYVVMVDFYWIFFL